MSGINPGIRILVETLQALGFNTCDSGDGVTHDFGCDRETGYVVMMCDPGALLAETDRLKRVLEDAGISFSTIGYDRPQIQATYDPVDGTAIIDVSNVNDSMLKIPA